MNLKLGEIELNGILLKKDTSIDEVINNSKIQSYMSNDEQIALFTLEHAIVDEYTFNIDIYFIDKHLDKITLVPINIEMKDPGYPDKKYQAEKKKVCDAFLQKHLGNPLKKNNTFLYYDFQWGSICSLSFLRGHDAYMGGFIEIIYK